MPFLVANRADPIVPKFPILTTPLMETCAMRCTNIPTSLAMCWGLALVLVVGVALDGSAETASDLTNTIT